MWINRSNIIENQYTIDNERDTRIKIYLSGISNLQISGGILKILIVGDSPFSWNVSYWGKDSALSCSACSLMWTVLKVKAGLLAVGTPMHSASDYSYDLFPDVRPDFTYPRHRFPIKDSETRATKGAKSAARES